MDESPILGLDDHRKFQMILGMLQWMVIFGRPELYQLVSSLNRFGVYPREGHLDLTVRSCGYIKTIVNKQISIGSRSLQFVRENPDFKRTTPDVIQDYPDAKRGSGSRIS